VILTALSVIVAGSLGGSRGNLGPKDTSSASALHQVDASTQVSTSILRYLQLNEKKVDIQKQLASSRRHKWLAVLKVFCLRVNQDFPINFGCDWLNLRLFKDAVSTGYVT
jgi:hypothetical protein